MAKDKLQEAVISGGPSEDGESFEFSLDFSLPKDHPLVADLRLDSYLGDDTALCVRVAIAGLLRVADFHDSRIGPELDGASAHDKGNVKQSFGELYRAIHKVGYHAGDLERRLTAIKAKAGIKAKSRAKSKVKAEG